MISAWTIYWILSLDSINNLFCLAMAICVAAVCIMLLWILFFHLEGSYEEERKYAKLFQEKCARIILKIILPVFILIAVVATFLPSSSDMSMIYIIPKISNSTFAKTIPSKLEVLANKELDALIKGSGK